MPWIWGPGYGWAGFGMMLFWTLIFLVLVGLMVWAIARGWQSRNLPMPPPGTRPPQEEPSALEILRRRFARGEIDAATYEAMRERLEASRESERPPIPST